MTSALAFWIVKTVGAIYLIYLGIKAIRNKNFISLKNNQLRVNMKSIFIQGILSNVLNPKVAFFFMAFLPQFVNPANGSIPIQMIILGLTFAFFGVIFLIFLGYFSGNISKFLLHKESLANKIRWLTGSLLVGLGIRLAFVDNR